jgi:hypothetical protein
MKRPTMTVLGTAAAIALLSAYAPSPASAAVPVPITPGATAYSAPASTGTATMAAALTLTGALGGLLNGLITPIINTALNPLVAALQGSINTIVGSALGASSTNTGGTPVEQSSPKPTTFPADLPGGLPSPCGSSTTKPCYQGAAASVNGAPLANINLNALMGYTQQVLTTADATNPIIGRTQIASPSVAVLPAIPSLVNPIAAAGTIDAKVTCPNDGSAPSAQVSAAAVTLLGGVVTFSVLNGAITSLVVGGTAYTLATLPVLNIAGVVVQPFGSAVKLTLPLTVAQVLAGLGLPAGAVTELLGDAVVGAALNLSVIAGPNTQVTATTAKAWGLGIGVDLSGSLTFNLLGLVGATVAIPTGIGGGNYGNLADLRLGFATCTSGSAVATSTPAVPPALV